MANQDIFDLIWVCIL